MTYFPRGAFSANASKPVRSRTPGKPGSKALAALDALIAEALPEGTCDLCGSPTLCARCRQR